MLKDIWQNMENSKHVSIVGKAWSSDNLQDEKKKHITYI